MDHTRHLKTQLLGECATVALEAFAEDVWVPNKVNTQTHALATHVMTRLLTN